MPINYIDVDAEGMSGFFDRLRARRAARTAKAAARDEQRAERAEQRGQTVTAAILRKHGKAKRKIAKRIAAGPSEKARATGSVIAGAAAGGPIGLIIAAVANRRKRKQRKAAAKRQQAVVAQQRHLVSTFEALEQNMQRGVRVTPAQIVALLDDPNFPESHRARALGLLSVQPSTAANGGLSGVTYRPTTTLPVYMPSGATPEQRRAITQSVQLLVQLDQGQRRGVVNPMVVQMLSALAQCPDLPERHRGLVRQALALV